MKQKPRHETKRVKGEMRPAGQPATFKTVRIDGHPNAIYIYIDGIEVASQPLSGKYFELTVESQDFLKREAQVKRTALECAEPSEREPEPKPEPEPKGEAE